MHYGSLDPATEFDENEYATTATGMMNLLVATVSSENQSHELKKLIKRLKRQVAKKNMTLIGK